MLNFVISVRKITCKGSTETVCLVHHTVCTTISGKVHSESISMYGSIFFNTSSLYSGFVSQSFNRPALRFYHNWFYKQEGRFGSSQWSQQEQLLFQPSNSLTGFGVILLSPSRPRNIFLFTLERSHLTIENNLTCTENGSFQSNRYLMTALCQSPWAWERFPLVRGLMAALTVSCIPGQRRDGVTWPGLSFSSQPMQQGRVLGRPAVVQVEKTQHQDIHCLIAGAACGAKGYLQPNWRPPLLLVCKWASKKLWTFGHQSWTASTPESRNCPLLPGWGEELISLALNNLVAKALKEALWIKHL